ncbi:hypothetical protein FJTKL_06179 [Diaporthe vaccinii]|uniref:Uncharacterized protein n=1 Tax=Diaporthe vaccinii TaxID=105482 RepID=A0ABR4EXM4_9PEZI
MQHAKGLIQGADKLPPLQWTAAACGPPCSSSRAHYRRRHKKLPTSAGKQRLSSQFHDKVISSYASDSPYAAKLHSSSTQFSLNCRLITKCEVSETLPFYCTTRLIQIITGGYF